MDVPSPGHNCLVCHSGDLGAVVVLAMEGKPPGHPQHQIVYSHTVLFTCSKCGSGQLEVLAHDCFDFEEVFDQYEWHILSPADVRALRQALCGTPHDPACACAVHTSLRASCASLPSQPYTTGLEQDAHVHNASLKWEDGLAKIVCGQ